MDSTELTLAQVTLRHRLNDIPTNLKPHIKMGFSLLARIDQEKRLEIQDYVIDNFAGRNSYDLDEAKKISGYDGKVIGDLISAITLAVGAVLDLDVQKEDFFKFAPDSIISEEDKDVVEELIDKAISCRDDLKSSVDKSTIASAVVPSFEYIDCEVDVRFKFNSDLKIEDSAAVAICYIKTDYKKDVFFQIEQKGLEKLINELTNQLRKLEILNSKTWG